MFNLSIIVTHPQQNKFYFTIFLVTFSYVIQLEDVGTLMVRSFFFLN